MLRGKRLLEVVASIAHRIAVRASRIAPWKEQNRGSGTQKRRPADRRDHEPRIVEAAGREGGPVYLPARRARARPRGFPGGYERMDLRKRIKVIVNYIEIPCIFGYRHGQVRFSVLESGRPNGGKGGR